MDFQTISCLPSSRGKRFAQPLVGDVEQDIIRNEYRKLMTLAALVCGVPQPTQEDVDAKIAELQGKAPFAV